MPGNTFEFENLDPATVRKLATNVVRGTLASGIADTPATCTLRCDCATPLRLVNATGPRHVALARRIGRESAVLLKNDAQTLPLRHTAASPARVALVGTACSREHAIAEDGSVDWTKGDYYVMGGSGRVASPRGVSIRQALARRAVSLWVTRRVMSCTVTS